MAQAVASLRNIFSVLKGAAGDLIHNADGIGRSDGTPFDPFEANGLRLVCRTDWPQDAELLRQWDELSRSVPRATAFHSPVWQHAAWQRFADAGKLRLLMIHRGGELLGVLPLMLLPDRGLASLAPQVSDYLDPLLLPEAEAECMRLMLSFVTSQWDRKIVELTFHNVRHDAAARTSLASLAPNFGMSYEEKVVEHCPAASLPATWDAFLAGLDPDERRDIRTRVNRAESKGQATWCRCPQDATTVAQSLEQCLQLIEAAGGQKGEDVRNFVRPVLMSAAPALIADGRLELWTLGIEGKPAAALLQFASPGGPMLFNFGIDQSRRPWSPGIVAVGMAVRQAIAGGAATYDLLRGREPYKYKFGATDRPLYRLTMKKC